MQRNKRKEKLDRMGLNTLRSLDQVPLMSGSSGVRVFRSGCFVKLGDRRLIEPEARLYEQFRVYLGSDANLLFPYTSFFGVSESGEYALFLEPILGETLETIILQIGALAQSVGLKSKSVKAQQNHASVAVTQVLQKLLILHKPQMVINQQDTLREFVTELEQALHENMQRAQINIILPILREYSCFWEHGIITLAHRDLSVVNIIVNDTEVRFIDPRQTVSNAIVNCELRFASPGIDLIALAISLERKELEITRMVPGLQLQAYRLVVEALHNLVETGGVTESLMLLMEFVVRSAYLACKCDYCLASERIWLYEHMQQTTLRCQERLFSIVLSKNSHGSLFNNTKKTSMKIVMLDWDGVVLNKRYQTTKDIRVIVRHTQSLGTMIVPNSDTPIDRLRRFCDIALGVFPEVVIGERGAVAVIGKRMIQSAYISGISQFREQMARLFNNYNHPVHIGDSTVWVRECKLFEPNCDIVLIDALREQTLGCFFLTTNKQGLPCVIATWADQAIELVKQLKLPVGLLPWDYNSIYGVAIANVDGISKTDGYKLLRVEYPDADFFMIGDSDSDIIADETVIHCAVSNSSPNLKQRASFVAQQPFTEGLEECLNWINQHYNYK